MTTSPGPSSRSDVYKRQGYPESLIELLEKNTETKDIVLNYRNYQGLQEIDVSGEVKQGEIPLFLQWDCLLYTSKDR